MSAKKAGLPKVRLVQPKLYKGPFQIAKPADWSAEEKSDGFRGALHLDIPYGKCWFMNKTGTRHESRFDLLCLTVASELRGVTSVILDGEILHKEKKGLRGRYALRSKGTPYRYVAFDILWLNGKDTRSMPLSERRKLLAQVLPKKSEHVEQARAYAHTSWHKLFDQVNKERLEGVVLKRLRSAYAKRTEWYKIKNKEYKEEADPPVQKKTARR